MILSDITTEELATIEFLCDVVPGEVTPCDVVGLDVPAGRLTLGDIEITYLSDLVNECDQIKVETRGESKLEVWPGTGGIAGVPICGALRAEDDPAYAAAEEWEVGIPRVGATFAPFRFEAIFPVEKPEPEPGPKIYQLTVVNNNIPRTQLPPLP